MEKKNSFLFIALMFSSLLIFSCFSSGNPLTGEIKTIIDGKEESVAGADVIVQHSVTSEEIAKTKTDKNGKFEIKKMPSQDEVYLVYFSKDGFFSGEQTVTYPATFRLQVFLERKMKVFGIIRLPDQSVSPKTMVFFESKETGEKKNSIADEGGQFELPEMKGGKWDVLATTPEGDFGFSEKEVELPKNKRYYEYNIILKEQKKETDKIEDSGLDMNVVKGANPPKQN